MTEESNAEYVDTQFRVEAVDGDTINEAGRVRLVVEGEKVAILAVAELALMFLQEGLGGQIISARDTSGNDMLAQFQPEVVDVLSTGDDPVA